MEWLSKWPQSKIFPLLTGPAGEDSRESSAADGTTGQTEWRWGLLAHPVIMYHITVKKCHHFPKCKWCLYHPVWRGSSHNVPLSGEKL